MRQPENSNDKLLQGRRAGSIREEVKFLQGTGPNILNVR
jgi:hypothetical protein